MNNVRIKICGVKTMEIAQTAVEYGADALGFVFYSKSPRNISIPDAKTIISGLPPFVNKAGVFADAVLETMLETASETGIDTLQFHAGGIYNLDFINRLREKTNLSVIVALRLEKLDEQALFAGENADFIRSRAVNGFIFDKYDPSEFGGTGKRVEIGIDNGSGIAGFIRKKGILAGGINSRNVLEILQRIHPYGIDVSSGLEKERGMKDKELVREFLTLLNDHY